MLTKEDIKWTKLNELGIYRGRRCSPGEFYFKKRTLDSIDPFTNEKSWTYTDEYCEPVIQILKGEEREIVAAPGFLERGDIIATIDWRKEEINTSEPVTVGDTQYYEAVYKDETYVIKQVHKTGLGSEITRQIIYLSKKTGG